MGKSVFGGFSLFGNKDSSGSSSIGYGVVEPESDWNYILLSMILYITNS